MFAQSQSSVLFPSNGTQAHEMLAGLTPELAANPNMSERIQETRQ
jgi:hypothetical protein